MTQSTQAQSYFRKLIRGQSIKRPLPRFTVSFSSGPVYKRHLLLQLIQSASNISFSLQISLFSIILQAIKMAAQMNRYKPYTIKKEVSDESKSDEVRMSKVVSNFVLGKAPYTQLSIGLNGLDVEITLTRTGYPNFLLSYEEFQELRIFYKDIVLSSVPADGANIDCIFKPCEDGGSMLQRVLQPYDGDSTESQRFELSRHETRQLEKQMSEARIAVEKLIASRPIFDSMYGVIVSVMTETYSRMNCTEDISQVYDNVARRFQLYTSHAYLVREFLNANKNIKTHYQLYNVVETCLAQHSYLRNRLEINNFLNWGNLCIDISK